ncbi:MAG: hypothetical protein IKG21_10510 [Atopobiaceae bacterium]|nr:hypothetical protein [Atopobiaceae bacterium]
MMLGRTPSAWFRKLEVVVLMETFARAFDVEPPRLGGLSANGALTMFREFTAACMEAALEDERVTAFVRGRLVEEAQRLGRAVRCVMAAGQPVRLAQLNKLWCSNRLTCSARPQSTFRVVRYLYRGIGIELTGSVPGALRFGPCSFAQRYTPKDCHLMSAFDEGFICGIMGVEGTLCLDCRLTEGAACCCARLEEDG